MSWDKPNESTISFECDSCGATHDCDIETVKRGAAAHALDTDFTLCWKATRGVGWQSFKRASRPWSYHCAGCAEEAAKEHREWLRNDQERERIKAHNAR